ncbi:MAG: helix-turn-helix domain-containing protein [Burkholderiaceae bacterium]|nr:helix-turn-helix domain-containing protein [Burkholderiaceae bacterium]
MSTHRLDPVKLAALRKIRDELAGTGAGTQRDRLQVGFQRFPLISTAEARAGLDILHPAARVQELREQGHDIRTLWTVVTDEGGDQHRVANYLWARGVQ